MWPCANEEVAEKVRTGWKAATRLVLEGSLVARLSVEDVHDLDCFGRHVVRTAARVVVEESAKRPSWAPADLRAGIGISGGAEVEVNEADTEDGDSRKCALQFGCCAVSRQTQPDQREATLD